MANAAPRNPPLAGRPPFAIDDQDEIYSTPQPQRRIRQHPAPDPNSRSSAYNMYDQYIHDSKRQSGAGALGMGFMNGDMDSDDGEDEPSVKPDNKHSALAAATHPQAETAIPLAAPQPGYAAPIAALNLARPSTAATPDVRQQPPQMQMPQAQRPMQMQMPQGHFQISQAQMSQVPLTLRAGSGAPLGSSRGPPPRPYASSPTSSSVPSTPHPLEEPMTPITPAFLRPSKTSKLTDNVQFATEPIMRGGSEDHLLPRRGDKGDDFWRRFSMVAKEAPNNGRESSWLVKTQSGTTRLSRWIWFIGVFLACCIAGGIVVGWYFSHNNPSNQQPGVVGGSANEKLSSSSSATSSSSALGPGVSSSPHVSPTNTVARRDYQEPTPTGNPFRISQAQSGLGTSGHLSPSKCHSRYVHRTHLS